MLCHISTMTLTTKAMSMEHILWYPWENLYRASDLCRFLLSCYSYVAPHADDASRVVRVIHNTWAQSTCYLMDPWSVMQAHCLKQMAHRSALCGLVQVPRDRESRPLGASKTMKWKLPSILGVGESSIGLATGHCSSDLGEGHCVACWHHLARPYPFMECTVHIVVLHTRHRIPFCSCLPMAGPCLWGCPSPVIRLAVARPWWVSCI